MKRPMSLLEQADWLRRSAGVAVLDEATVVRVGGDDARSWLQGQITNDVLLLADGASCYALLLDAQGKIDCDLFVVRRGEALFLVLPRSKVDEVLARLDRYVVMEDVELARRDDLAVLTVQGPRAAEVASDDPDVHAADRLGLGGFDRLVAREALDAVRDEWVRRAVALSGGAVSDAGLALARIRAGRAALGAEAGPNTLPQEVALAGAAVSFKKGCYVGQEPVVMLEHRGKPPKRLVRVEIPPSLVGKCPVGLALDGQEIGKLTSAAPDPECPSGAVGLALVRRTQAVSGSVLASPAGDVRILDVVGPTG